MLWIGAALQDITACRPGVGMMGWSRHDNVVEGQATPLVARAFVFREDDGPRVAVVVGEFCFTTLALKQAVMERLAARHPELELAEERVLITATHTHSGPGGYSHYVLYQLLGGGYQPEVVAALADGMVGAIAQAAANTVPARVQVATGAFADDLPIAFNRSLEAYNRNPEVWPKLGTQERHRAVEREMTLLRFDALDGGEIGSLNVFPVHCINVLGDDNVIHHDNKGVAARLMEAELARRGARNPVTAFAQGCAGDVTPNFRAYPGSTKLRGVDPDDNTSARIHGTWQFERARSLHDEAAGQPPLSPALDAVLAYVDMSDVRVPPELVGGREDARTAPAAIGARMLQGTAEGPGISALLGGLAHEVSLLGAFRQRMQALLEGVETHARVFEAHRAQWPKALAVEAGDRRAFGFRLDELFVPDAVAPAVALLKSLQRHGALGEHPWAPNIVPLQIVRLGEVALVPLPCEPTTQAGRRLRARLADQLAPYGVKRVLVLGLSNAYAGYVATPEEYVLQDYEGASTHFGRWTLPAYQAELGKLVATLGLPGGQRARSGPRPHVFSPDELTRRVEVFAGARRTV